MFNKSLTVVLPVYNGETRLRKSVNEILELASELTSKFGVLIIDDGSNDSTFEVAEELAAHYPQVSVRRHRQRRGLGSAIDYAQRRLRTDAIILHDGVTPIDTSEIKSLWRRWTAQTASSKSDPVESAAIQGPMSDLANLSAIHAAMEKAHARLIGFQMVEPLPFDEAFAEWEAPMPASTRRNDSPRKANVGGVGQIPLMPRPKFLTAIANFALGE
ncbi:MAG TPA: glycosyltransferase [Lacipirellulaceae bacterium]|nr:glycosyltransferase [Lacipirellulaceae bacterium]